MTAASVLPALGLSLEGGEAPAVARALATAAAAGNAGHLWIACHLFQREPIAMAAGVLAAAPAVRVTLMAMSPYSVHPVYAVMAAATLDEWFPGRVSLCFGVGAPRDLTAAGIAAPQPLQTLREAIAIARALLAGETIHHDGQRFQVHGRSLATGARPLPIELAASGPQMLELAGRVADGVLLSAGTSIPFLRWCLDQVAKGEAASGRRITRAALVYASVADDARTAHDRLRRRLAFILRGAHHARNIELGGATLDQERVAAAFAAERWDEVDALVGDDVVRRHAASGTAAEVIDRFGAYAEVGLDELVLAGQADPAQLTGFLGAVRGR